MSRLRLAVPLCFLALPSLAATFGTVTPVLGISDLVLDEPRGRLYLINSNLNRVDVFTTATRTFRAPISTDTRPLSGAMSRDGKFLYVTAYDQSSLGLTGLHQILRRQGKEDERRYHRDLFYARNASLGLDLYLLWRTLGATDAQPKR